MFTTDVESPSIQIIKEAIEYNESRKNRLNRLWRYFDGDHEIRNRKKPSHFSDHQVIANHARYIVNIYTSFMFGNKIEYIADAIDIDPVIQSYERQLVDMCDIDLGYKSSIFGSVNCLQYIDGNEPKSTPVDPRFSLVVYDDTVQHNPLYGIIYSTKVRDKSCQADLLKGSGGELTSLAVYTTKEKVNYIVKGGEIISEQSESKPHPFGDVPLIEFKNNIDCKGDFESVIELIDAYNLIMSDRVNDKEQLVEAMLALYGFDLTDKQIQDMKIHKTLTNIPTDGKVEYLIKSLDETQVEVLHQRIKDDIHQIAMIPDMSDDNFAGNSSGVAIAFKLLNFVNYTNTKRTYFEMGLRRRFKQYWNYYHSMGRSNIVSKVAGVLKTEQDGKFDQSKLKIVFKSSLPKNDFEASQMIRNLEGLVPVKDLISQLSFIDDSEAAAQEAQVEKDARIDRMIGDFGKFPVSDSEDDTE